MSFSDSGTGFHQTIIFDHETADVGLQVLLQGGLRTVTTAAFTGEDVDYALNALEKCGKSIKLI
jgi:hypothetical protein